MGWIKVGNLKGPPGNPATNLVTSVAGRIGAVVLAKNDVGLSNVDNTSDVDKPVSVAQQEALDTKVEQSAYDADKVTYGRIYTASGDTTGATDTAAIQALIDQGGAIHLAKSATYYVAGLVMKTGAHLHLNGATMKLPDGANDNVITTLGADGLVASGAGTVTDGIKNAGIYGPGLIDGNKDNQTIPTTTVTSGSNGVGLPAGTINVASTTGFPSSGWLSVTTTTGVRPVQYTGKTSTSFTGCTGGSGTLSTGAMVYPGKGFGVLAYWRNCTLGGGRLLEVRNCFTDGIWTEWGSGTDTTVSADGAMENVLSGIKCHHNGRNGLTFRGAHDSWLSQIIVFSNGVCGALFNGFGSAYVSQFHAWGGPQQVGVDLYTEVHFDSTCAIEVTGTAGSVGLRANFIQFTYKGRIFLFNPSGQPTAGAIGLLFRGCTLSEVDAEIADCQQGAIVVTSDGGHNSIKASVKQDRGPAIARLVSTVAAGSNGVDVSSFNGTGTLNTASNGALGFSDTTNFPASGAVMVRTSNGSQIVTYTGRTATTLTGCSSSGSGVMSTGGVITQVYSIDGGAANDTTNLAATSTWEVTTLGGTTARSYNSKRKARRASGSITIPATADTYSTAVTITPNGGAPGLGTAGITLGIGGTVASETITFLVTATHDDGTQTTQTRTSTTAQTLAFASGDWIGILKDGRHIVNLEIQVKSSKASTTATASYFYAG